MANSLTRLRKRGRQLLHTLPIPPVLFRTVSGTDDWSLRRSVRRRLNELFSDHEDLAAPATWKFDQRFWRVVSDQQLSAGFVAPLLLYAAGIAAASVLPAGLFPIDQEQAGVLFQTILLGTVTLGAFVVPLLILHVQFTINRRFPVPSEDYWRLTGLEAATALVYSTLALELLAFWLGQHVGGGWEQALATGSVFPSLAAVTWLAFVTIRTVRFSKPGALLREWLEDIRPRLLEPIYAAAERVLSAWFLDKYTSENITVAHLGEPPNSEGAEAVSAPQAAAEQQVRDIDVGMLNRRVSCSAVLDPEHALHVNTVLGDRVVSEGTIAVTYGGREISHGGEQGGVLSAAFRFRQYEEQRVAELVERLFEAVAEKIDQSAYRQAERVLSGITELITDFQKTNRQLRVALSSVYDSVHTGALGSKDRAEAFAQLLGIYWHEALNHLPDRHLQTVVSLWASLWELALYSSGMKAMASAGNVTTAFELRIEAIDDLERREDIRDRLARVCWRPFTLGSAVWSVDSFEELFRYFDQDASVRGLVSVPLVQLRSTVKSGDIEAFQHYLRSHREHSSMVETATGSRERWDHWFLHEGPERSLATQVSARMDLVVSKVVSWALSNIGEQKVSLQFAGQAFDTARSECASTVPHVVGLLEHSQDRIMLNNDRFFDWRWERPRGTEVYTVPREFPWMTRAFVLDFIDRDTEEMALPELEGDVLHSRPTDLFAPVLQEYRQNPQRAVQVLRAAGEMITEDEVIGRLDVLETIVEEWQSSLEGMRERWVARQTLDESAVDELISNTRREYEESRLLGLLLEEAGNARDEVNDIDTYYSVRRLHDRGAFLPDWPVGYSGFAEQVGRILARSEDKEVGERILGADPPGIQVEWEAFDGAVDQAIERLTDLGYEDLVILLSNPRLRELLSIEPKDAEDPDNRYLLGRKSGHFVISCPGVPNHVAIVFDLRESGVLEYRGGDEREGRVGCSVEEIGEDRAAELLEQQPQLAEQDGEVLAEDEALAWLQTQVDWHSRLYVRYVVDEPDAAYVVEVERPPEGDEFLEWLTRRRREERAERLDVGVGDETAAEE